MNNFKGLIHHRFLFLFTKNKQQTRTVHTLHLYINIEKCFSLFYNIFGYINNFNILDIKGVKTENLFRI